jgi:queuine tRNA-ribosyltransferase subunit QTRTD1
LNAIGGKRKIDAAGWVKMQRAFRADLFAAMSFDVQFYSGNKRVSKSVDATIAWLDELLPPHAQNKKSILAQGPKSTDGSNDYNSIGGGAMFAVIQGANNEFERRRCIKATIDRMALYAPDQPIQGFIYGGFGVDDLPEDRSKHISVTTSLLPAEYPRLLPVVDTPEDILDAVALGIDLFSNSYPGRLAELGHAFTFSLNDFNSTSIPSASTYNTSSTDVQTESSPKFVSAEMGGDRNKINLKDPFYELDKSPLLRDCSCYTCTKHTRAYIHHLINTHEMLATILLVIHNTHHYLAFFNEIRKAIDQDQFATYRTQFVECYRRPL